MVDFVLPPGTDRWQYARDVFLRTLVPRHLKRRFLKLKPAELRELYQTLLSHGLAWKKMDESEASLAALSTTDLMLGRLGYCRLSTIPLLDHARSLSGQRVLEIGCGTGCFTVALAEQDAQVTGVDIHEVGLEVARKRCAVYGLDAAFHKANAVEVQHLLAGQEFDLIVFYATLEHMTVEERLTALAQTWDMLDAGGLLCVAETPNRLWLIDSHTTMLPFFHWLPDDLAFAYAQHSPRRGAREVSQTDTPEARTKFLRQGRGVSYHEFDLAIGPVERLQVVSSLQEYAQQRCFWYRLARKFTLQYRFARLLGRVGPKIHPGFYERGLYLVIRKQ